jgi:hypothetical protein
MNANFDMYWDSGYAVIVLCNVDSPIARQVNRSGNESGSDAAPSLADGYNQARTGTLLLGVNLHIVHQHALGKDRGTVGISRPASTNSHVE